MLSPFSNGEASTRIKNSQIDIFSEEKIKERGLEEEALELKIRDPKYRREKKVKKGRDDFKNEKGKGFEGREETGKENSEDLKESLGSEEFEMDMDAKMRKFVSGNAFNASKNKNVRIHSKNFFNLRGNSPEKDWEVGSKFPLFFSSFFIF